MPTFKGVRHFVYEKALMKLAEETGYLQKGTGATLFVATVAFSIPLRVYQGIGNTALYIGGRAIAPFHTPYVKPGTAPTRQPMKVHTSTPRNYGIARIGGGIHSPFLGAFTFAPIILTGAGMFQDRFGRDPNLDAV